MNMKSTPNIKDHIMSSNRICIIGGGPAGMMAAGTALNLGADVTLFESMPFLGKKLGITGKGRCNVTNCSDTQEFLENVTKNPRFLYSALRTLSTYDTMGFFENLGVELKVERGNRVYPSDDKARTIVDAMRKYCKDAKIIHEKAKKITKNSDGTFTVEANGKYVFDKVILATGGKSYPLTGSDGSGFRLATSLGHNVTQLIPSLIPINSISSGKITAAATTGPAKGPLPTSSVPAITLYPSSLASFSYCHICFKRSCS